MLNGCGWTGKFWGEVWIKQSAILLHLFHYVYYFGISCVFGCPYMVNYCSSTKQVYMVFWVSWWMHCVLFSKRINCSTPAYQMFHFNWSFYAMIESIWLKCSLYEFIMFICFYLPIAWTSHSQTFLVSLEDSNCWEATLLHH